MNIAFDIDGVLADTHLILAEFVLNNYGIDVTPICNKFDYPIPGITTVELHEIYRKLILEKSYKIPPYISSLAALLHFHFTKAVNLHFVTARQEGLKDITVEWLKEWLKVPFTVDIGIESDKKGEHLKSLGFDAFVEDRFQTAIDLSTKIEHTFLLNRPWNKGREVPEKVKRISSLQEIEPYL